MKRFKKAVKKCKKNTLNLEKDLEELKELIKKYEEEKK